MGILDQYLNACLFVTYMDPLRSLIQTIQIFSFISVFQVITTDDPLLELGPCLADSLLAP